MKAKRLSLWLGVIGAFLLVPGTLWFAGSRRRLSDDEVRVALQPLQRIRLDRIDQGLTSVTLVIPETTAWTKIRKVWGEPEFVISAADTAGKFALCLPEMPVRIELIDRTGGVVSLRRDGGPYGYSTTCASPSLRFRATPGNELTLRLTSTRQGTAPAGDLIIVSSWFDTKDRLVGLSLDKDIESFVKWLSIPGFLLVVSGVSVFFLNRIRHRAVK